MDKETTQESPSLLPTTTNNSGGNIKEESPRHAFGSSGGGNNIGGGGGGCSGGDRLKRDEWSEGAVSSLLESYENKWILRNRAKLKGHDWEDVARHVSSRANFTKSPKTLTQCKNKIESMKKRYRSESATAEASSWPLYPRLDLLLRGSAATTVAAAAAAAAAAAGTPPPLPVLPQQLQQPTSTNPPLVLLEPSVVVEQPPPPPLAPSTLPPVAVAAQNSHGSNGVDREDKDDGPKLSDHVSDKHAMYTDSSTPALYSDKEKLRTRKLRMKMEKKRKRREECEIADSIRWLAEVVARSEQARMDTMRDLEKMRIEAETRRSEMDLKRTEIIANAQLEIARLFAGVGKGVDSSLRIGRN